MTVMGLEELIARVSTLARAVEPIRGVVTPPHVEELRVALEEADAAAQKAELPDDEIAAVESVMSQLFARSAVVAIAGANEVLAARWFKEAKEWATDPDDLAMLELAARSHERYRLLVYGRYLMAHERDAAARKAWKEVATTKDLLGKEAEGELAAPRPIRARDSMPTLRRVNGIGAGFYGRRDQWPDGSYATTHCFSVLWIPLFALSAWRVRDTGHNSYSVLAREQLSTFARLSRFFVLGAIVVAITGYGISAHFSDPGRLARIRFDDAVADAAKAPPEAALRLLDGALSEMSRVDPSRAEHAGAEVVRLTAGFAPKPFTERNLDQATRLVNRYRALPLEARGGEAADAITGALEGWVKDLGDRGETADARLTLLHLDSEVAEGTHKADIDTKITAARLAVAAGKAADAPLDALDLLLDGSTDDATLAQADKIVARLVEAPSVLATAEAELDTWSKRTHDNALRDKVKEQRELAVAARNEVMADGVTPKQLAAMAAKRPWDQFAPMMLARTDAMANKNAAAIARLTKLGPAGLVVREARFLLAQLLAEDGKLDEADAIMTSVIGARLPRYAAASAAFHEAVDAAEKRLKSTLDSGVVPQSMRAAYEAAAPSQREEVVGNWFREQMMADPKIAAARDAMSGMSDVVSLSLVAGSLKLRRAQAMTGSARNAMLEDAERMFLAIRADAEGKPEFRLGLGEIYARLGKTKESDAELDGLLAQKDAKLSLEVSNVYRNIGSSERAKKVAADAYAQATDNDLKQAAASSLGVLTADDDEVSESWFRKANQSLPFVQTSLLEIEAQRLARQGKHAECAAKFAQAAKAHLASAGPDNRISFNNAAVADQYRFMCSGDVSALQEAASSLDRAYRGKPDESLVVGNYAGVLEHIGLLNIVAKRVDVRALRLTQVEGMSLIAALTLTPERDAVLAEVAAEPNLRKSDELMSQFAVLAPNSAGTYVSRFAKAALRYDAAAGVAVVDALRQAKALDTSDAATNRKRWLDGSDDVKRFANLDSQVARFDEVIAAKGDPKTRAVALWLAGSNRSTLGLYRNDPALLARARDNMVEAEKLWPVLRSGDTVIGNLLDEAGLAADGTAWMKLRRERSANASLDALIASKSPVADAIRKSTQWAEVARVAKTFTWVHPSLGEIRLARALGDQALIDHAKAVFDDKLARAAVELSQLLDPTDATIADEIAYLDKR